MVKPLPAAETREKKLTKLRVVIFLADVIATILWVYLFLNVFVTDLDAIAQASTIPGLAFVATYKFLFFAGVIGTLFLLVRNIWALPLIAYIFLFPIIVCFWKVPRWLWKAKSPLVTLAFLNSVISFFKSIRYVLATGAIAVVFAGILLVSTNYLLNAAAIVVLILVLAVVYVNKVLGALRPAAIYEVHSKFVSWFGEHFRGAYKPKADPPASHLDIELLDEPRKTEWVQNVQMLVIANRGAYFLSDKLKKYQASNAKVIFYLLHLLVLVALSVLMFAVMNYGLWRAVPTEFQITDGRFFLFVYYSVASMFGRGIPEIVPISDAARLLSILQILSSFLLVGIIVILIFSFQSNRDEQQLDAAIVAIQSEGQTLDRFIESEFRLTTDEAIRELDKAKSAFIKIIYYLANRTE